MVKTKIDYSAEREIVLKQIMERSGIDYKLELENIFEQLQPLKESPNPVKRELRFVPPYFGKDDIKLIIIGQDPTIRNEERRKNITCTLNLDKSGALTSYVKQICEGLGITIENVFATNIFKYFYTTPPAQTFDLLKNHLPHNIVLLKKELELFPEAPVITLGEPVLKLLTNDKAKVRNYWGYNPKTKSCNDDFDSVGTDKNNEIGRVFYPFCHQPSLRKQFYQENIKGHLNAVKTKLES